MVGSSATVNRKAGKYIITSGLSLPEGFSVNYGIQREKAGQREKERLEVRAQELGSWEDEVDGRVDGINQNPVCLATGRFLW